MASGGMESGRLRLQRLKIALLILGPLVLAAAGVWYFVFAGRYVSTENAYIKADEIAISAEVSGRIIAVPVEENQRVAKGDVLFRIDPAPYRIALDRAEAALRSAQSDIRALKAEYRQTQAKLSEAGETVAYRQRDFDRKKRLRGRGNVPESALDDARHALDVAQQEQKALTQSLDELRARLDGNPDIPVAQHPRYREALAERDQAALDLRHTVVHAPAAGVVSNITLQVGEYVQTGDPLFSVTRAGHVWVTANLKETELTKVRVGQKATLEVDTYPGRTFRAFVKSISPATGAEFSALPPQNATGNWVKVVQRVPVRLELVPGQDPPPLRAGMSVYVSIDIESASGTSASGAQQTATSKAR